MLLSGSPTRMTSGSIAALVWVATARSADRTRPRLSCTSAGAASSLTHKGQLSPQRTCSWSQSVLFTASLNLRSITPPHHPTPQQIRPVGTTQHLLPLIIVYHVCLQLRRLENVLTAPRIPYNISRSLQCLHKSPRPCTCCR